MSDAQRDRSGGKLPPAFGGFAAAVEYMTDAAQRSVLYLDVMRQRGNAYREHAAQDAPHVPVADAVHQSG